ncbi:MAG TPA: MerR family transcriptional regulator [Anaerolineae bacterium]|nr:MerR family transcriptional regulator [Anaerolineae bacterium]
MSGKTTDAYHFMTRRQVAITLKVPQRIVDQWIATGQLTPIRMSMGLGRGGQRVFYSAEDVKKLKRAQRTRKQGKGTKTAKGTATRARADGGLGDEAISSRRT